MGNWGSKDTCSVDRVGNCMDNRSGMNNRGRMVSNGSSMVNNWGSMVNNWGGMVNNWRSMDHRGMVNNRSSMYNWSSMDSRSSSITSYSLIGDVNNVTGISISAIAHNLGPAIRESHSVVTRGRVSISLLLLSKVSTTVVITDTILISIKSWLSKVRSSICGCSINRSRRSSR